MTSDEEDSSIEEELPTCSSVEDDRASRRYSLEEYGGMLEDDIAEDDHTGESCSDDDSGIQE